MIRHQDSDFSWNCGRRKTFWTDSLNGTNEIILTFKECQIWHFWKGSKIEFSVVMWMNLMTKSRIFDISNWGVYWFWCLAFFSGANEFQFWAPSWFKSKQISKRKSSAWILAKRAIFRGGFDVLLLLAEFQTKPLASGRSPPIILPQ